MTDDKKPWEFVPKPAPKGALSAPLIKAFKETGQASLPLPDDSHLTPKERQAGRQRLRSLLVQAAFRAHYRVTLKTTDKEVIAKATGPW